MKFSDPYGILSLMALAEPTEEDALSETPQNIEQYVWPLILQSHELSIHSAQNSGSI